MLTNKYDCGYNREVNIMVVELNEYLWIGKLPLCLGVWCRVKIDKLCI